MELHRLALDKVNRDRPDEEIEAFDTAVPAARHGRDILEHFDELTQGPFIVYVPDALEVAKHLHQAVYGVA